jgi:plasmid stabilization system protein ParE
MRTALAHRAARDLRAIFAYIREENPAAAHPMLAAVVGAIEMLCEQPRLGREVTAAGARRLAIPRTPYIAYYRIEGDEVLILHVRDGRRKPYRA